MHGGWHMARAAQIAARHLAEGSGDTAFLQAKVGTARFFADHVLASCDGLAHSIVDGASGVLALEADQF